MNKNGKWIGAALLAVALICGVVAANGFMTESNAGSSYEDLQAKASEEETEEAAKQVEMKEEDSTVAATQSAPEEEPVECPINFAEVMQECPDCYAWIRIPDTNIDYPIVQSPTDNAFYLDHNAYGDYEYAGAIFTEDYNAKDFSDLNTVIYGHNMKNGSMFQNLHFYEDMAFMEEHPTFEIYLPDKILTYQVFAAYNYDDRHLMTSIDYSESERYLSYLNDIVNQRSMSANIDKDVELTETDRIVTLSTCNGIDDQRYLVQGVLLSEVNVTVN